jgi:hypothetical protein
MFVTFNSGNFTTTSLLLHLLPTERAFIEQKLGDAALQPLMHHPLFTPTLVMELLFQEASEYLHLVYCNSVGLYIAAELHTNEGYRHLKKEDLDMEEASETALGYEQHILILCEKIESNLKIGTKLLSWFDDLPTDKASAEQRTRFDSAGVIIRNRLENLIDGFEFQLIRLKRVQGHAQYNRLGVGTINTSFQDRKTLGRLTGCSYKSEMPHLAINSVLEFQSRVEISPTKAGATLLP